MQHSDDIQAALQNAARLVQKLQRRVAELEGRGAEPIAIVGAGCRLPGGIADLGSLWQILKSEVDVMGPPPAGRLDPDVALAPDALYAGERLPSAGGWLDAVDQFDAAFFGISPREAAWTDPQQRLLLECAWEALERAGITRQRMRKATTGVYVGLGSHDYAHQLIRQDAVALEPYLATGTSPSFAAGRIAYALGLQGPALTLDTSCSSSLVALHVACRALRADECDLALVGGVQLMLSELPFVLLSRLRALSPDGRCKTFSDKADGYGRSEGCVVLAVERLSDALRQGDPILGLIRGSAINHDGDKSGITTPNGNAQRVVIRKALADARLQGRDVDYVEAHGTGTPLGDPIELDALAEVYAGGRTEPLRIGSLKSNLGHLEAAAGLAGVLKVLAALRGEGLPANLHSEPRNRRIDWATLDVKVVTELEPWCRSTRVRRASVSSFGMSGTNAHVVLEESPMPAATPRARPRPAELVVLSAKCPSALRALTARLHEQLQRQPELELADVAYSLALTRTLFGERWVLCAATRAELELALADEAAGSGSLHRRIQGRAEQLPPELTWLLPGVGAERLGMGQALYREWPVFRAALDAALDAVDLHLEQPLRSALLSEAARGAHLERPAHAECALFALGWALGALWRSWGVEPGRVVADGCGEITAACLTGVMSLADGARCVTHYAGARRAAFDGAPASAAWVQAVTSAQLRPPTVPWVSSCAGALQPERVATPGYWLEHVAGSRRLEQAARALAAAGAGTCIELAPGDSLATALEAQLPPRLYARAAAEPAASEYLATLNALSHWIAQGGSVNYPALFPDAGRRIELSTYPWQRQRHWIDVASRSAGCSEPSPVPRSASITAPVEPSSAGDDPQRQLVYAEVARVLGLAGRALPVALPLGSVGLDSVMALELESALCRRFDISLSASASLESLSARALADSVIAALPAGVGHGDEPAASARRASARASRAAVASTGELVHGQHLERVSAPRARLFCFPGAGGSAAMFRPFASLASAALEVHVISRRRTSEPGALRAGTGQRYLDEAAAYIRGFSGAPTLFMGHSLGSLLAWRVAAELAASGHQGPALFVPSAMAPRGPGTGAVPLTTILAPVLAEGADPSVDLGAVSLDFAGDLALYAALPDLPWTPVECPIAAFCGLDDTLVSVESMHDWRALTRSDFSLTVLPGDHFYLHRPAPLGCFLKALRERVVERWPAHARDQGRSI